MVRLKHRYILVNILYPDAKDAKSGHGPHTGKDVPYTVQFRQPTSDRMDGKLLLKMVRDGVSELFGDYGSGMVAGSLQIKYFSATTSTAIIRVARDHYRLVWAALTFITHLPRPVERVCVLQVVRVSGTIKKAEEEAIRRARISIQRAQRVAPKSSVPSSNGRDVKMADDSWGFEDGIEDPNEAEDEDEMED